MQSWLRWPRLMLTSVCLSMTVLTAGGWPGQHCVQYALCSYVYRWGVGQNLYVYKQSLRRADTDWERAVKDWYEEVMLFSRDKVRQILPYLLFSSLLLCFAGRAIPVQL